MAMTRIAVIPVNEKDHNTDNDGNDYDCVNDNHRHGNLR